MDAHSLLVSHGETRWARNLERAAVAVARDEAEGIDAVLGLFGGMGALTDRLPIDAEPDASTFKAIIEKAHSLAYRRKKVLKL